MKVKQWKFFRDCQNNTFKLQYELCYKSKEKNGLYNISQQTQHLNLFFQ